MDSRNYLGLFVTIIDLVLIYESKGELEFSACYGTYNNFLELDCPWREKIKIHHVYQGAKPIVLECPYPVDQTSYKEDCCVSSMDDCMFEIKIPKPNDYESYCNGRNTCKLSTMWAATTGHCDPKKYNSYTNFMKITYSCFSDYTTTETTISPKRSTLIKTISSTYHTTVLPMPRNKVENTTYVMKTTQAMKTTQVNAAGSATKSSTTSTKPPQAMKTTQVNAAGSATKSSTTSTTPPHHVSIDITKVPSTKANIDEEDSFAFTTGMMGAMAAAIIGLMLTIFGFIFYWGRKRRHLIMTKPQTSVWDFLLSQSITFRRPFKGGGYDNFNNHRSSISSDGETSSPVTRKAGWTPNIAVETVNVEPTTSDDNCSIVDVHRHV